MLGLFIFIFWGIYAFFCEFETLDITKISEIDLDNDTKRFIICFIIIFIICFCINHCIDIDTSSDDWENFKNLMKDNDLKWSDLFSRNHDKGKDK